MRKRDGKFGVDFVETPPPDPIDAPWNADKAKAVGKRLFDNLTVALLTGGAAVKTAIDGVLDKPGADGEVAMKKWVKDAFRKTNGLSKTEVGKKP